MTRALNRTMIVTLVIASARPAAADHLTVTVVDVAGGMAYVDKGSKDGVVRGTRITFGKAVLVTVEVTETSAVVELGTLNLAIGAKGTAVVTPGASELKVLPKPRPPEAFRDQWPAAEMPSATQDPKLVALGAGGPRGRTSVTVIGRGFAAADKDRYDAAGEARLIASFKLMTERPLAADVDVAGRAYREGANSKERVPLFVRAAQIRYGDANNPRVALGRLRYAASSIGMLDGVRAAAHLSRIELAAFGGLVPDPVSGKPETSASRFGVEAVFDDDSRWRPRVAVTAYGSTWEGELDEKRLAVSASANHGALWLDGWGEAQAFSSDNPWNAKSVEVTGAGATASWRNRGKHVAADITYLRPERSLRLAAALPPEWLCTQQPQIGAVSEECTGGDSWASGSLSAGMRGARWSVDAIGAIGRTNGVEITYDTSGFLLGEVRFGPQRLFAGASAGRASFARWTAGQVGMGFVMSRRLDIAASYRPELLDYVAATEPMLMHAAVLDLHYAATANLDLAVSAVGTTGADRDVLAILSTIIWRPIQ